MAVVRLKMEPGWHTYWRYPGDSGERTRIKWKLPPGIEAGAIQWPAPERLTEEGISSFVFHGELNLAVPLNLSADLKAGTQVIEAKVSWIECSKLCVPGSANVSAQFLVGATDRDSVDAGLVTSARESLAKSEPKFEAEAFWDGPEGPEERALVLELPGKSDFFPFESSDYEISAASDRLPDSAAGRSLVRKKVSKTGFPWPSSVAGLVVSQIPGVAPVEVVIPVRLTEPPAKSDAPAGAPRSLMVMLGLAFVGGLILNIMPCVLPVIALKILGFVKQTKEEPGRIRVLGVAYTAGVMASFMALAALPIGLKLAGKNASWGMQFQSPQFLVVMMVVVLLVALNLFGVFEVYLGGGAMSAASGLASKSGKTGAFFNGVLATALATPCTAPFLGVALGFAFVQSPFVILLFFLTIGAGLALPYLLLCLQPAWLKFLPKPGDWMVKFKMIMGFPMLATVVWLYTITVKHFGEEAMLWLGLFLVVLALAAWVFGEFIQRGYMRKNLAWAAVAALLVAAYGFILEHELDWRSPEPASAATPMPGRKAKGSIAWLPWSPEAVAAARTAGQAVLVDFTADWCMTCKVNAKTAIEVPEVRDALRTNNIAALMGDYTKSDARIGEELKRHQRAGVPLVLVFPRDPGKPPRVLPEVLTKGIVLDALKWATK